MSTLSFTLSFILAYVFVLATCNRTPVYTVQVLEEFPHDPTAFTQGLVYAENDILFESTGLYGSSSVRKVALPTGKVEIIHKMDDSYFGEGLTLFDNELYQLVWKKNIGFIYDRRNLTNIGSFVHEMKDGWGLTTDGKVLYGSDGTSTLYTMDPHTFKVIGKHSVQYNGHEVFFLNELEYINGEVWANVWQTDCIARISRDGGILLGWILLPNLREELLHEGFDDIDVLNGIAWDSKNNRIFVTGKLWPKMFEIKLHRVKRELPDGYIEQICLREKLFFEGIHRRTIPIDRVRRG